MIVLLERRYKHTTAPHKIQYAKPRKACKKISYGIPLLMLDWRGSFRAREKAL
ncbi:hypothetical protein Premu_0606 [Hallella multisaccharivorax DSM 17128]|uniref:Uncharacterized protein n=1 Tax=Hallella multisaccharivorax DSM 17128 TaxID=688246 RepID=F8N5S0_9BACT|nr:hypothetical protein Premu_0606 [Hallella multisaccharivorax DSM 17128]